MERITHFLQFNSPDMDLQIMLLCKPFGTDIVRAYIGFFASVRSVELE